MGSVVIDRVIEDIQVYIEGCRKKSFSNGNEIIVMKDELLERLDEIKMKVPEEIRQCQKIVQQRDAILANAKESAAKIIDDANRQAEMLVQESEIMRQAYLQANEMVARANQQANDIIQNMSRDAEQIRTGALSYTNEMLEVIERLLSNSYEETRLKSQELLNSLHDNLNIIIENRRELTQDIYGSQPERDSEEEDQTEGEGDDYDNMDPDAFLKNI